jgi:hypothetical protein
MRRGGVRSGLVRLGFGFFYDVGLEFSMERKRRKEEEERRRKRQGRGREGGGGEKGGIYRYTLPSL